MNPPGMFCNGARMREQSTKDTLALSERLIPEFSGRRNVRDMFSRQLPMTTSSQPNAVSLQKTQDEDGSRNGSDSASAKPFTNPLLGSPNDAVELSKSRKAVTPSTKDTRLLQSSKRNDLTTDSEKPSKRPKPNSSTKTSFAAKGQTRLGAFFTTKPTRSLEIGHGQVADTPSSHLSSGDLDENATPLLLRTVAKENAGEVNTSVVGNHKDEGDKARLPARDVSGDETVHDPIESKESWTRLFAKPVAPRCEAHNEPCKVMVARKPGINCGRSFWVCSKPLGPSGVKENGTEWRCGTFIWCSDWKPLG